MWFCFLRSGGTQVQHQRAKLELFCKMDAAVPGPNPLIGPEPVDAATGKRRKMEDGSSEANPAHYVCLVAKDSDGHRPRRAA